MPPGKKPGDAPYYRLESHFRKPTFDFVVGPAETSPSEAKKDRLSSDCLSDFPIGGSIRLKTVMSEGQTLLRKYQEERCEESFRALVDMFAGMVRGTAARRVSGQPDLVEDVVQ